MNLRPGGVTIPLMVSLSQDPLQAGATGVLAAALLLPGLPNPAQDPPAEPPQEPVPPATPAWPTDYSFDDGTLTGKVPAGKVLVELDGGFWQLADRTVDGAALKVPEFLDLQAHVAPGGGVDGTAYGETLENLFIRGAYRPAQEPYWPEHLKQPRWEWRFYEGSGTVFRGCIFWRAGKWLAGAHEGHAIYGNVFGDLTIEDCVFYECGAQAAQLDWRGGCSDPSKGWFPETLIKLPAEYVDPDTGLLGRGLPDRTIAIRRCAVIECGKIRAGAPFQVEVERDSWDFTLYAPGQRVEMSDVYMRELKGTRIQSSTGVEAYASVGILHQDARRCYARKAPWVKLVRIRAEARMNDRPMVQVGDAEDVLLDELDLHDLGFDVADPADDRVPTVVLESTVPHAVIEHLRAPVWLELRPWNDPHRSTGARRLLQPGERWEGSPASMSL